MSRDLSAENVAEIDGQHVHIVNLVHFAFDEPIFVHSGVGVITFDGNQYQGVGHFGGIGNLRESELLGPRPVTLSLSGVNPVFVTEAMEAGRYGDSVTLYEGYRQDDGTLVGDPWVAWSGWYEYASVDQGETATIAVHCQNDLSVLERADGGRFSDEDQQQRFSGDTGFEFVADVTVVKLQWGGRTVGGGGSPGGGPAGGRDEPLERAR